MTIKQMLELRAQKIAQARAIMTRAEQEKRQATAEENQQFDTLITEANQLKADADKLEADAGRKLALETAEAELEKSRGRATGTERADSSQDTRGAETRRFEFRKSVCGDERSVTVGGSRASDAYLKAYRRFLAMGERSLGPEEIRALQADVSTSGGYLLAPMQLMAELIQGLDNEVFMRRISRVLPPLTAAASLGAPSLDTDVSDPKWTTEIAEAEEDTAMAFGRRELKPHPVRKMLKVSETLIRMSGSVDSIVRERLAYKFGIVQENGFLTGSGNLQPLGVFTASANGISTGRDVSTGNTTTELRFDGLKNAMYSLKAGHRMNAQWIFHRDALSQLAKLKDGEGRYIWQQSVIVGQPDRLLNLPFNESEYAPNTFESGKYVGILGDFRYYWIVDSLTLQIKVLAELYARTNQIGYIGSLETDGMPVLEEAFARVKLG